MVSDSSTYHAHPTSQTRGLGTTSGSTFDQHGGSCRAERTPRWVPGAGHNSSSVSLSLPTSVANLDGGVGAGSASSPTHPIEVEGRSMTAVSVIDIARAVLPDVWADSPEGERAGA